MPGLCRLYIREPGQISINTDIRDYYDLTTFSIDLIDDPVSARILAPVDLDFEGLGGKSLRVSPGMELAFRNAMSVAILKGVSIMGVPIPSGWLGGLKNIDLVSEFADEQGFWAGFAEGVDNIRVVEGELKIKLKE